MKGWGRIESMQQTESSENPEEEAAGPESTPQPFKCDFCGALVPRVRRVALDQDYDRLQVRHQIQYACSRCSEEKERRRLASRGD